MDVQPPRIYPCLRYEDAPAMIEWLVRAFAFEKNAVYAADDGSIAHAQLSFGSAMIMLGSGKNSDSELDKVFRTPREAGPLSSQTIYIAVDDVDAHHNRAKAAGAEILMELTDQPYGSRDYICKDPEGNVWCFGTYWPKVGEEPQ
ncbi:MAG: hypothetical protein GC160_08300 [Acidobacteria bacterium]|nr:hypothetical protein [Acidobacteriota bacterium]